MGPPVRLPGVVIGVPRGHNDNLPEIVRSTRLLTVPIDRTCWNFAAGDQCSMWSPKRESAVRGQRRRDRVGGSWKIGRVAGIDLYVHWTFLILLGWIGLVHYLHRQQLSDAVYGMAFICTLFAIVVLHELGHALTARRFGIRTRDITLLPIGGVARLERMPEDPFQELLVALAGPAVNVVLAALLFAVIRFGQGLEVVAPTADWFSSPFLLNLMWVNIVLAVFNLLPAFPMDGGRVLRAFLAMRLDYVRATQVAASVGQTMAMLFGFVGLFSNPFLVFIAIFVWIGAAQEASMVQMKSALSGIPVRAAMMTDFHVLAPDDPVSVALDLLMSGAQQDFPVVDVTGQVVGILTRDDLLRAFNERGRDVRVADVMHTKFETVDPADMLDDVMMRLQTCQCHSVPVVRNGQLVGLLTKENFAEFLMFAPFLRAAGQGAPWQPNRVSQIGQ